MNANETVVPELEVIKGDGLEAKDVKQFLAAHVPEDGCAYVEIEHNNMTYWLKIKSLKTADSVQEGGIIIRVETIEEAL